ncbi:EAL domain-containing protein [Roseicyclus sp. F158]|uniref:EAL domain-containing protein n=1 Tax=Tropicimonas omnivorans TaxID=3075590 RepID=A0ABU3DJ02_9RHOB|nr:EAL domain-containing protein [Roseicyclus sp. F158]MDT0683548.1 EAL domain-containing protein [Roseicyclus sp. F158]
MKDADETGATLADWAGGNINQTASIQPGGCLVEIGGGRVLSASVNTLSVLGTDARDLLGTPLTECFTTEAVERLEQGFEGLPPPYYRSSIFGIHPFGDDRIFDIAIHRNEGRSIIEFESLPRERPTFDADVIQPLLDRIRSSQTVERVWSLSAHFLRELTGFDRVMVYRFAREGGGEVISESLGGELPSFLGRRFSAGDILPEARERTMRYLPSMFADIEMPPVPVVSIASGGPETLDLSQAAHRAVAPERLRSLRDMGVAASMSISFLRDEAPWGMIICHHPRPHRPDFRVRLSAEMLTRFASAEISRREEALETAQADRARGQYDRVIALVEAGEAHPGDLGELRRTIGEAIEIDGLALSEGGRYRTCGHTPTEAECLGLARHMERRGGHERLSSTSSLAETHPGLVAKERGIGGVIALPIRGWAGGFVMLFRSEVQAPRGRTDDSGTLGRDETGVVFPRSFEHRDEAAGGRCAPWTGGDLRAAEVLRVALLEFARVRAEAALCRSKEKFRKLAFYDPLTGLPNRALFVDRFAAVAAKIRRSRKEMILLRIDVDHFKDINETFGRQAGDTLLYTLAQRIENALEGRETLARLGADEFAAIVRHTGPVGRIEAVTDRIRKAVSMPLVLNGTEVSPSVSMGAAIFPHHGHDQRTLMHCADIALYRAKATARGTCAVFDDTMTVETGNVREIESDLRLALARGELVLAYQPQLDVAEGRVTTVEALVRWKHPRRGLLPPHEFIPVAESTGLIHALSSWVITEACRQIRIWRDAGLDVRVGVNVSTIDAQQDNVLTTLDAAMERHGISGSNLEVEITETLLLEPGGEAAKALFDGLRARGVHVAIDDFGTGYSALSYLKDLPCEKLKIDRVFIKDMRDIKSRVLVEAIVGLGRNLGKIVVAEGVETPDQYHALKDVGCDMLQGFLFARPEPADRLPALLGEIAEAVRSGYAGPENRPLRVG